MGDKDEDLYKCVLCKASYLRMSPTYLHSALEMGAGREREKQASNTQPSAAK